MTKIIKNEVVTEVEDLYGHLQLFNDELVFTVYDKILFKNSKVVEKVSGFYKPVDFCDF
jgi:hypothetical protein